MSNATKMPCSDCGSEMNHHADKIDYSAGAAEPDSIDEELGGVVGEIHTCPECGKTALRIGR